jgi:hypothetical protein
MVNQSVEQIACFYLVKCMINTSWKLEVVFLPSSTRSPLSVLSPQTLASATDSLKLMVANADNAESNQAAEPGTSTELPPNKKPASCVIFFRHKNQHPQTTRYHNCCHCKLC